MNARPIRSTLPRQTGFTLLEAICTLAIAAMILVTLIELLTVTLSGYVRAREVMRETRVATGIERVFRADLAGAYRMNEKSFYPLVGRAEGATDGAPSVEFFTTHSFYSAGDASPSGLYRVEYSLRPSEQFAGAYTLLRREVAYTPGKPIDPNKPEPERLADALASWGVEYFDGAAWVGQWQKQQLPGAVRIAFSLAGPPDSEPDKHLFCLAPLVDPAADAQPPKGSK